MAIKLLSENWYPPPPPVCFGRIDTSFIGSQRIGCTSDSKMAHSCAFTKLCIIYRDFWLEKEAEAVRTLKGENDSRGNPTDQYLDGESYAPSRDSHSKIIEEAESTNPRYYEDQTCQDSPCPYAPLGCSDRRYCPRGGEAR